MSRIVAAGKCTDNVGVIMTSDDDGLTWAQVSTPGNGGLMNDVASGSGAWVAGGFFGATNQVLQRSTDGAAWTAITTALDDGFFSVAGIATDGTGNWVAAASGSTISPSAAIRSTDNGVTWAYVPTPIDAPHIEVFDVAYGAGRFLLLANDGADELLSSTDGGATWAVVATSGLPSGFAETVDYLNGLWVVTGGGGTAVGVYYSSDNGATWALSSVVAGTPLGRRTDGGEWSGPLGLYVTATSGGFTSGIYTTPDLTTAWTQQFASNIAPHGDVLWTGSAFLFGGAGGTGFAIARSTDGSSWTSISTPMNWSSGAQGVYGIAPQTTAAVAVRALWHYGGVQW